MVLDIATAFVWRAQRGVELTEDVLERFAADIRQHVQSTSIHVAHAQSVGNEKYDNITKQQQTAHVRQGEYGLDPASASVYGLRIRITSKI